MVDLVCAGGKCAFTHLGCVKTLIMFPRVLRINTGVKKGDFYVSCAMCSLYFRLWPYSEFYKSHWPCWHLIFRFSVDCWVLGFIFNLSSEHGGHTLFSALFSFILKVVIFLLFYIHRVASNFNTSPHVCHLVAVICFIGVETELEKDMTRCPCLVWSLQSCVVEGHTACSDWSPTSLPYIS